MEVAVSDPRRAALEHQSWPAGRHEPAALANIVPEIADRSVELRIPRVGGRPPHGPWRRPIICAASRAAKTGSATGNASGADKSAPAVRLWPSSGNVFKQ